MDSSILFILFICYLLIRKCLQNNNLITLQFGLLLLTPISFVAVVKNRWKLKNSGRVSFRHSRQLQLFTTQ